MSGDGAGAGRTLFATRIHEGRWVEGEGDPLFAELETACLALARDDAAGRAWCREHGYAGYTSYASLTDLPVRDPAFGELKRRLDRQVARFGEALAFDLSGRRRLRLDSLWVNVLARGGAHSGHIHPHSAVSGTAYVRMPPGAAGLKLEDPRAPLMMAAPLRRADAPEALKTFVTLQAAPGDVLLWESWLRHEVPAGRAKTPRISVSFNYA